MKKDQNISIPLSWFTGRRTLTSTFIPNPDVAKALKNQAEEQHRIVQQLIYRRFVSPGIGIQQSPHGDVVEQTQLPSQHKK